MTGNIIIENHQGRAVEIHIEGIIGTPERDSSPRTHSNAATYARFRQQLEKLQAVRTSELIVHIRSTGGNVNDALLIHDTLRNLDCEITTRCYGYTASAATLIAQAASPGKREMSANGLYLIHRAACNSEGDADTLGEASRMLHKTDERSHGFMRTVRHAAAAFHRTHEPQSRQRSMAHTRRGENLRIDRYDFHRGLGDKPD